MREIQSSSSATTPARAATPVRYGKVEVVLHPTEAVVSLQGDIDVGVADEFDGAAHRLARAELPVHLDASRVTFCDSAAVHFLARLLRAGLSVRVSDSDDRVATLLALAKAPAGLITAVQTSTIWRTPTTDESEPAAEVATHDPEPPQQALAARLARLRREHRAAERARGSATRN
jgi:anti-anti-sigma regulatory factor